MEDLNLEVIQSRLELHEKRLNDQESMFGSLLISYIEMFAAVEMLVKTVVQGFPTEEEQKQFLETFSEFRNTVIKSVQEASRSGTEGLDPDAARAMEDVAQKS